MMLEEEASEDGSGDEVRQPCSSNSVLISCGMEATKAAINIERLLCHKECRECQVARRLVQTAPHLENWRLQEGPCAKEFYSPCIACDKLSQEEQKESNDCRFYNRMLRSLTDPKECRRITLADIEPLHDEFRKAKIIKDTIKRRPKICSKTNRSGYTLKESEEAQIAAYVIQCVCGEFSRIVEKEEEAASYASHKKSDVYFSKMCGIFKQICDLCEFAILNVHFCCVHCGLELCFPCFQYLCLDKIEPPSELHDEPCVSGAQHTASMFRLASFLPTLDDCKVVLSEIMRQSLRYDIQSGRSLCNGNHGRLRFQEEKCYCPVISNDVKLEPVCLIHDQAEKDALKRFKAHLAVGHPIIVEGINRHPKFIPGLWTREAFERITARDKALKILDCRTNKPAIVNKKQVTVSSFWKEFALKRGSDHTYLKIKDFPESTSFDKIAPDQFDNFFEVFPFQEYAHVNREIDGKGRLNLLTTLNLSNHGPDPGPKGYIAEGLCDAPDLASTALHLDVSDAANFMAVVESPQDMSRCEILEGVTKRLDLEGITGVHRERVLNFPEKAGAIWKIFDPKDNQKIRGCLLEWKNQKGKEVDDGDLIHSRDVVVTPELVSFLAKRGVDCRVFVQMEGDVVFIPAGSAHHVQNINACIKLAEDIVSLEGISHVVAISDELRSLRRFDDLVQIEDILLSACSEAASVLAAFEPCWTSSCLSD